MFQYPRRQNVSILQHQNMSQRTKCLNTPILYTTTDLFLKKLLAIEPEKTQILMKKPVYLHVSILEISKTVIHKF